MELNRMIMAVLPVATRAPQARLQEGQSSTITVTLQQGVRHKPAEHNHLVIMAHKQILATVHCNGEEIVYDSDEHSAAKNFLSEDQLCIDAPVLAEMGFTLGICTRMLEAAVNAAIQLHIEIWIRSARMHGTAVQRHRNNFLSHACTALMQGAKSTSDPPS